MLRTSRLCARNELGSPSGRSQCSAPSQPYFEPLQRLSKLDALGIGCAPLITAAEEAAAGVAGSVAVAIEVTMSPARDLVFELPLAMLELGRIDGICSDVSAAPLGRAAREFLALLFSGELTACCVALRSAEATWVCGAPVGSGEPLLKNRAIRSAKFGCDTCPACECLVSLGTSNWAAGADAVVELVTSLSPEGE